MVLTAIGLALAGRAGARPAGIGLIPQPPRVPADSSEVSEVNVRDSSFDLLVRSHPEAMFAAIAPDGFRVPVPVSVGLAEERIIPPPVDRATLVDLVIPADAMAVIETWQRAERTGMAIGTVHTRVAPGRAMTLTFVDQRERHGVVMASFTDQDAGQYADTKLTPSLLVPARPRTGAMTKDWQAVITGLDDRASRMLGWTAEQVVGLRSSEFIHPDDLDRSVSAWMEMLATYRPQRVRLRHRCMDGEWLWVEIENTFRKDDHDVITITTQITDISDEMAAHAALDRQERLFRRLAESLPIGLIQLDRDGSLVYANSRLGRILGVDDAKTLDEQLATVSAGDRPALDLALARSLEQGLEGDLEVDVMVSGIESRRCQVTLIALSDQDGTPGALACISDITDSARARAELTIKATFDALTGCFNRDSVQALLDRALTDDVEPVAAIFIDLDKFKPVNDTLGHAAGDELLVHTARYLADLLRDGDAVARLGGDEFLVVIRGVDEPSEALTIAQRAQTALFRPVPLNAGTVDLAASIGVAVSTAGDTAESLIAKADAAMYESKRRGDGAPVIHSD